MTNETNNVLCPSCEHENKANATKCARCGTALVATVPVPDVVMDQQATKAQLAATPAEDKMQMGAVAIYVAGQKQPIVVKSKDEIIVGRHVAGQTPPTVDLTPYHAHLLGVSRRHVKIAFSGTHYTIEDLGSSNGTWLNENPLPVNQPHPLRNGDLIRLGQLIVFVYFSTMVSSILLTDSTASDLLHGRMTPDYLHNTLSPYLQALADLQHLINEMKSVTPSSVSISSLGVRSSMIYVNLSEAADAVEVVQTRLTPWKKSQALNKPTHADPKTPQEVEPQTDIQKEGTEPEPSPPPVETSVDSQDESEQLPSESPSEVQKQLVVNLINYIAPQLAQETKDSYTHKLLPPLNTLLNSPFEISVD